MSEGRNLGGRPAKYSNLDELQTIIDNYFAACEAKEEPITITGLALALDTTRETLCDIEKGNAEIYKNPGFSDAIKRAKLRCQNYAEKTLFTGKNPAGSIFALKNYGWKDKQDIEINPDQDGVIKVSFVNSDE